MASFRSAAKQAAYAAKKINAIGSSRADAKAQNKVSSVRTLHAYRATYERFSAWLKDRGNTIALHHTNAHHAIVYLHDRAAVVGQKTLDVETSALRKLTGDAIPRIQSTYTPARDLAHESRAYTRAQIELIVAHQDARNALATLVSAEAGLRASELATLRRYDERPPKAGGNWHPETWSHRENWERFTVKGKGGLVREIRLSSALARELELNRIAETHGRDRGVDRCKVYDIGSGNAHSQSFSGASRRALGFSHGAHGLRHGFAQSELRAHIERGINTRTALRLVSQQLGHWRHSITFVYLR